MVKLFDAFTQKITPPEGQVWNDPDPRIQWALDILEPPLGNYEERIATRFMYPLGGFALGISAIALNNAMRKIPIKSNLFGFLGLGFLGIYGGEYARFRHLKYKAEELATIKHYIMLHPEKFPEPEPMKYGDKRVFYPWQEWRRPCLYGVEDGTLKYPSDERAKMRA